MGMFGMDNSFEILSEEDKRHLAYQLCVLGWVAGGATAGSFAGGMTLAGAAGGAAMGLLMCKGVERPLKWKLFSQGSTMSEGEFRRLAVQTSQTYGHLSHQQVLDLLAAARIDAHNYPGRYGC
jgi:hypothetical protein